MSSYKAFYNSDATRISVEHWQNSMSVDMHMHDYFELFYIEKGSCTHIFNGAKTLLIPGDCFLIYPHREHGFTIHNYASIFNCQFYPDKLEHQIYALISRSQSDEKGGDTEIPSVPVPLRQADINQQGIIHMDPQKSSFILNLLQNMQRDQETRNDYYEMLKVKYLEVILLQYKNKANEQFKNYGRQSTSTQALMTDILTYIEKNLTNEIDFNELAAQNSFSPNYFRKLFKDFTGLSPVEYINRLRIIKAYTYLQNTDLCMSDIAANVGIYDANYFSRLFKQYMGCSPRKYVTRLKN